MRLKVKKFYARSFILEELIIFWEMEDLSKDDDIYAYEFILSRCEHPSGPFLPIADPFFNLFQFRDTVFPTDHKNRTIYYQLKIRDIRSNEEMIVGPTAQLPEPNLEALEIIRWEDILLRQFTGRKCYLFPRKTFGQRCICFNTVTQRGEVGNCLTCFGQFFIGGYNSPVSFYCQIDSYPKTKQMTPDFNHTINLTSARTVNYPEISPGDLLIESENKRWTVIESNASQRLRADVHQELKLKEILRSEIGYKIPVLDDIKKVEEIAERRLFTNPQNLHTEFKPTYLGEYKPDGLVY